MSDDPGHLDLTPPGNRAAEWIYRGLWSMLVQWFRVPGEPPTLPAGADRFLETFKPDPAFVRYMKLWYWILVALIVAAAFVGFIVVAVVAWWAGVLVLLAEIVVIGGLALLAYIALHLRYDTTWYVMTSRSLRLRRGAWVIHEMTITFENVQNVKVQQGPVQRLFGIATLLVETAGSSGESSQGRGTGVANRGLIEGIREPKRLRDLILTHLRASRGSGLGDVDEEGGTYTPGAAWTRAHVQVLREIRDVLRST